jgi:hypothetical protein
MLKDTAQKIDITNNTVNTDPAEIYSSGVQFAMFNDQNEQICQWVVCRDFFSELIWSQIHNKPAGIYGFKADPSVDPKIDFENTRFLIRNRQDKNFLDKIDGIVDFVNQIEDIMNLRKTEIFIVNSKEKNGEIATVASGRWMRSPVLLSMYSLFLRVGFCHTVGDNWKDTVKKMVKGEIKPYQRNDAEYLKQSIKGIEKILTIGYKNIFYVQPKFNYPEKKNVSKLHNSSGIVSFSSGDAKTICNGWYREDLKEIEKNIPQDQKVVII